MERKTSPCPKTKKKTLKKSPFENSDFAQKRTTWWNSHATLLCNPLCRYSCFKYSKGFCYYGNTYLPTTVKRLRKGRAKATSLQKEKQQPQPSTLKQKHEQKSPQWSGICCHQKRARKRAAQSETKTRTQRDSERKMKIMNRSNRRWKIHDLYHRTPQKKQKTKTTTTSKISFFSENWKKHLINKILEKHEFAKNFDFFKNKRKNPFFNLVTSFFFFITVERKNIN